MYKRQAVDSLPESSRKQVDGLLDRVNAVSGDVNKTVDEWRSDLEKRVTTLRKETESRRKKFVTNFEKQTRRYVERVFKQFKLPVRGDVDSVKRRMTALERRVAELEDKAAGAKTTTRKAAAA